MKIHCEKLINTVTNENNVWIQKTLQTFSISVIKFNSLQSKAVYTFKNHLFDI